MIYYDILLSPMFCSGCRLAALRVSFSATKLLELKLFGDVSAYVISFPALCR